MSNIWHEEEANGDEFEQLTAVNPADIRHAAMDLLARREHSRLELKQKLKRRFDNVDLIEDQLDTLAKENLQSDTRYSESFLRQRIGRGHGPLRIRREMRQKGIPDSGIIAALEAEQPDWYSRAEETYRRKFGELPPEDIREKARRSRFMQYRGFTLDHYQHLLD